MHQGDEVSPNGGQDTLVMALAQLLPGSIEEEAMLVPVTLQLVDRQGNHHPDLLVPCGAVELWS